VSCLPRRGSAGTAQIVKSFDHCHDGKVLSLSSSFVDLDHCIYREGYEEPASSYVIRSRATGSRTIVNFNELPEMTVDEFVDVAEVLIGDMRGETKESTSVAIDTLWHFEVCRRGPLSIPPSVRPFSSPAGY